ncbi:hypothetical protein FUAX_42000 (plasmid) [Fulvitalea axinellae]|uniref:Uncharacterized protein n=1 Tax=Fulvitalea axinellae TaxID=1182444 RepID=A0AAU9D6Y3_9BACT|nr:hypothetical protein FUAX_42000 [Fulvitalea axinellae]
MFRLKNFCATLFALFIVIQANAQTKVLSGLSETDLKFSGVMRDSNNDVDGYYYLSEVGKLKKGKREYLIRFLDKNLNEVASKTYIDHKGVTLLKGVFNKKQITLMIYDPKLQKMKLIGYDRKGKELSPMMFEFKKNDFVLYQKMAAKGAVMNLYPVDNEGVLVQYSRVY